MFVCREKQIPARFRVEASYAINSESFRELFEVEAIHAISACERVAKAICGMFKNVSGLHTEVVA